MSASKGQPPTALIAGRYQIEEIVGRGSLAETWRAVDLQTNQTVALKRLVLHADKPEVVHIRQRALEQARLLQHHSHPNVARVLDAALEAQERPYVVTEWLPGEDLAHRQQHAPLGIDQALDLMCQVLLGLESLHAKQIVHRNLEPSNVFLVSDDRGPRVKLLDIGPSLHTHELIGLAQSSVITTALPYLAPEQVGPEGSVDPRSDLYAVGVMLYELATGQRPFVAADASALIRKIVTESPPPPSLCAPDVPPWLDTTIMRAMMRASADRFQSANEMRSALLVHRTTSTSAASPSGQKLRPSSAEHGQRPMAEPSVLERQLVGQMVGEYRVTGILGTGGMGTIFSGEHPLIGKRVAIKVLKAQLCGTTSGVERFVAEARAVNAIRQPNIVDIFSFGTLDDGRQYFVMEYVDGSSLSEFLESHRPVRYADALRILSQVLSALHDAHEKGIVHRDLKPDNIMLTKGPDGELFVKLLDFGIAKFSGEGLRVGKTDSGIVMGTPVYMSPEQCLGHGVDHRSDIYALGVILYEMFTGRVPFTGPFLAIANAHVSQDPRPPRRHARIPRDLDRAILWCLHKDKAQRPKDIADLRATLIPLLRKASDSQGAAGPELVSSDAALGATESLSSADHRGPHATGKGRGVRTKIVLACAAAALAAAMAGVIGYAVDERVASTPRTEATSPSREERAEATVEQAERTVLFQLQIDPPEVQRRIWVDGQRKDQPYFRVPLREDRQIEIVVEAPGYQVWRLKTFPAFSQNIQVQLKKRRRRPKRKVRPDVKDDLSTVL